MKLGSGILAQGVQGPGFSLQYLQKGERKRSPIRGSSPCFLWMFVKGRLPQDDASHLSPFQTQDQDLSTISPAIIFESMFQNSDDPAVQDDPLQTGMLSPSPLINSPGSIGKVSFSVSCWISVDIFPSSVLLCS